MNVGTIKLAAMNNRAQALTCTCNLTLSNSEMDIFQATLIERNHTDRCVCVHSNAHIVCYQTHHTIITLIFWAAWRPPSMLLRLSQFVAHQALRR